MKIDTMVVCYVTKGVIGVNLKADSMVSSSIGHAEICTFFAGSFDTGFGYARLASIAL